MDTDCELYLLQQGRHAYLPKAVARVILEYSAGFEVGACQPWRVVKGHWLAARGWCKEVVSCCGGQDDNCAVGLAIIIMTCSTPVVLAVLLVSMGLVALPADLIRQCRHRREDQLTRESSEVGPIDWFQVAHLRKDWLIIPPFHPVWLTQYGSYHRDLERSTPQWSDDD